MIASTSTSGFILVTDDNKFVTTHVRRANWTGTEYFEARTTDDIRLATLDPDHRFHRAIAELGTTRKLLVKVTRIVEIQTEELNFNLTPE